MRPTSVLLIRGRSWNNLKHWMGGTDHSKRRQRSQHCAPRSRGWRYLPSLVTGQRHLLDGALGQHSLSSAALEYCVTCERAQLSYRPVPRIRRRGVDIGPPTRNQNHRLRDAHQRKVTPMITLIANDSPSQKVSARHLNEEMHPSKSSPAQRLRWIWQTRRGLKRLRILPGMGTLR
jgi:hypothetical protein